ncbi:MAG: hypothetical protein HYS41_04145 [Candidatus Omnitrophica bacterium]|nr:hypothetical protein [Candidatus Omnitrophota bacterium]
MAPLSGLEEGKGDTWTFQLEWSGLAYVGTDPEGVRWYRLPIDLADGGNRDAFARFSEAAPRVSGIFPPDPGTDPSQGADLFWFILIEPPGEEVKECVALEIKKKDRFPHLVDFTDGEISYRHFLTFPQIRTGSPEHLRELPGGNGADSSMPIPSIKGQTTGGILTLTLERPAAGLEEQIASITIHDFEGFLTQARLAGLVHFVTKAEKEEAIRIEKAEKRAARGKKAARAKSAPASASSKFEFATTAEDLQALVREIGITSIPNAQEFLEKAVEKPGVRRSRPKEENFTPADWAEVQKHQKALSLATYLSDLQALALEMGSGSVPDADAFLNRAQDRVREGFELKTAEDKKDLIEHGKNANLVVTREDLLTLIEGTAIPDARKFLDRARKEKGLPTREELKESGREGPHMVTGTISLEDLQALVWTLGKVSIPDAEKFFQEARNRGLIRFQTRAEKEETIKEEEEKTGKPSEYGYTITVEDLQDLVREIGITSVPKSKVGEFFREANTRGVIRLGTEAEKKAAAEAGVDVSFASTQEGFYRLILDLATAAGLEEGWREGARDVLAGLRNYQESRQQFLGDEELQKAATVTPASLKEETAWLGDLLNGRADETEQDIFEAVSEKVAAALERLGQLEVNRDLAAGANRGEADPKLEEDMAAARSSMQTALLEAQGDLADLRKRQPLTLERLWTLKPYQDRLVRKKTGELFHVVSVISGYGAAIQPIQANAQTRHATAQELVANFEVIFAAGLEENEPRMLAGHTNVVRGVAFSPKGETLVSVGGDGKLLFWDVKTGRTSKYMKHANAMRNVAFSPNGETLAFAGDDQTLRLSNVETGQEVQIFSDPENPVWSAAFSPNGKILASVSGEGTTRLWDVKTGQEVQTFSDSTDLMWSLAFSPDGKILASASGEGAPRFRDVKTGQEVRAFANRTDLAGAVAFSPDGKTLVSGSRGDQTLRLLDVKTGQELRRFTGHADRVLSVAFSPNGETLASASADLTIRLWDVKTGKEVQILRGHTDWPWSLAFSPDGKNLASAGADRIIRLWDVPVSTAVGLEEGVSVKSVEDLEKIAPELVDEIRKAKEAGKTHAVLLPVEEAGLQQGVMPIDLYAHTTVSSVPLVLLKPTSWVVRGTFYLVDDIMETHRLLARATELVKREGGSYFAIIVLDHARMAGIQLPEGHPVALLLNQETQSQINTHALAGFLDYRNYDRLKNLILDLTAGTIRSVKIEGRDYFLLFA